MNNSEQQFLKELDVKLWSAADRLRNNLDAANYKHVVLGIIFLKYVSDAFEERQQELRQLFTQDDSDDNIYYMPREDYDSDEEYNDAVNAELELHEYYQEKNVFWIPKRARWKFIKSTASLPIGSVIDKDSHGNEIKLRSISWLIDNALDEIESHRINDKSANPKLKGVLPRISRYEVENTNLTELINRFSDTSFSNPEFNGKKLSLKSKDILGHVYEYFLGQFALAEGKQGGQYYTPKSIVTLIVELLEPYQGRVYDPAMGSGGFFVSSEKFIEEHAKEKKYNASEQKKHISVYGQESNPTTWKLAAMNMAIRGIDFNFGNKNADTFLDDQHPDLKADFVMANPPFNMKEWWSEKLQGDIRWMYGTPPKGNANYGWLQHIIHHLNSNGKAAILLSNGSLTVNAKDEYEIRKSIVDSNLLDCVIALPTHLFTNTQIGACIWCFSKAKDKRQNRAKNVLFINAKNLGTLETKVIRSLSKSEIEQIADCYKDWVRSEGYKDQPGFCRSVDISEIERHKYALVPGRYVGFDRKNLVSKEAQIEMFKNIQKVSNRLNEVVLAAEKTKQIMEKVSNG